MQKILVCPRVGERKPLLRLLEEKTAAKMMLATSGWGSPRSQCHPPPPPCCANIALPRPTPDCVLLRTPTLCPSRCSAELDGKVGSGGRGVHLWTTLETPTVAQLEVSVLRTLVTQRSEAFYLNAHRKRLALTYTQLGVHESATSVKSLLKHKCESALTDLRDLRSKR